MSRAELEAAAAERYPDAADWEFVGQGSRAGQRAAYIRGRLDQAEADARVAEGYRLGEPPFSGDAADLRDYTRRGIAAAIRQGVE